MKNSLKFQLILLGIILAVVAIGLVVTVSLFRIVLKGIIIICILYLVYKGMRFFRYFK